MGGFVVKISEDLRDQLFQSGSFTGGWGLMKGTDLSTTEQQILADWDGNVRLLVSSLVFSLKHLT